jgi:hypothetical protein
VAFIAVTTVARWNQNAVIYFMVLCAVVCFLREAGLIVTVPGMGSYVKP